VKAPFLQPGHRLDHRHGERHLRQPHLADAAVLAGLFIVDDSHPLPADYVQQVNRFVAEDRHGDAVALFMKVVGVPEEVIPQMCSMPVWPELEEVAHTLAYDGLIVGDNQSGRPLRPGQWPKVTAKTVVIVGGEASHSSITAPGQ
jgi:hypothetical protein